MDNYLGEIKMFAGNFAPVGWANCDGSLLPVNQNDALFVLLGTTYGGDGVNNFALPDLRGRVPVHIGTGPGLQPVTIGQKGGTESTTVLSANLPAHSHLLNGVTAAATVGAPSSSVMLATTPFSQYAVATSTPSVTPVPVDMNAQSISANVSANQSIPIVQPFTVVSYIIATTGIFPTQS